MSLLDKASLVVTPNAYKASKLYSVIPSSGAGDMDVVRATTATRVNSLGLIESVAVNIPRIDYTNGSCPSLLVEPQRTNLITYSVQFDNAAWGKSNSLVIPNTAISPDGNLNADTLKEQTTINTVHRLAGSSVTVSSNSNISYSVYVKKNTLEYLRIVVNDIVDVTKWAAAQFNLNDQTYTTGIGLSGGSTIISASITNVGSGWFRINLSANLGTTQSVIPIMFTSNGQAINPVDTRGGASYIGSDKELYIWGAQLELGSYASSYVPTVATAVTRNADVISKTGISSLIGQTEGTIYTEIKVNKLIGIASRYIFHISDGTANNRIYIAFSGSSSNVLRGRIFSGGTLQCSIDSSTITTTGTYKLALAYKNNDIVFYINGVQIGVDTSASIPTCSRVDIGHNYEGSSQLGDAISKFKNHFDDNYTFEKYVIDTNNTHEILLKFAEINKI